MSSTINKYDTNYEKKSRRENNNKITLSTGKWFPSTNQQCALWLTHGFSTKMETEMKNAYIYVCFFFLGTESNAFYDRKHRKINEKPAHLNGKLLQIMYDRVISY